MVAAQDLAIHLGDTFTAKRFASLNRFTPYPGTALCNEYFKDKPIRFRDLYQLNPDNPVVRLDDGMERKIAEMFQRFDELNAANKRSRAADRRPS